MKCRQRNRISLLPAKRNIRKTVSGNRKLLRIWRREQFRCFDNALLRRDFSIVDRRELVLFDNRLFAVNSCFNSAATDADFAAVGLRIYLKTRVRLRKKTVLRLSYLNYILGILRLILRFDVYLPVVKRNPHVCPAKKRRTVADNHRAVRTNRVSRTVNHPNLRSSVALRLNRIARRNKNLSRYQNSFTSRRPNYPHIAFKRNQSRRVFRYIVYFRRGQKEILLPQKPKNAAQHRYYNEKPQQTIDCTSLDVPPFNVYFAILTFH